MESKTGLINFLSVTTALWMSVIQVSFTQIPSSKTTSGQDEKAASPNSTNSFIWQLKLSTPGYSLNDVSFANPQVGYVAGEVGPVFKTTNGGENWEQIDVDAVHYWWGIEALSPDTVIVSGVPDGVIRWTFDGGNTWSAVIDLQAPVGVNTYVDLVHFFNPDTGIVRGMYSGGFYRTTTGGKNVISWTYIQVDPELAWFEGNMDTQPSGNIYTTGIRNAHSSDFGEAWTVTPCADPLFDGGVDFLDDNRLFGWTGGGTISPTVAGWVGRTTDGGENWAPRIGTFPYPIRAVKFFNETFGFAVGGDAWSNVGGINSTTDGGYTWSLDLSTGAEMYSIETVRVSNDSVEVWCAGASASTGKLYKIRIYQPYIPVELTNFTATAQNGHVELNWTTATETNNRGFEIQRSSGSEFEGIAFVAGHGTTTETQLFTFVDRNVNTGSYTYRLKQIDFDGKFEYSKEVEVEVLVPYQFVLEQNYPNPFNPSTKIKYSVPQSSNVEIKVFDILGKEIKILVNEEKPAGSYDVIWDAANLSAGVYVYQIKATPPGGQAGSFIETKKMILLK